MLVTGQNTSLAVDRCAVQVHFARLAQKGVEEGRAFQQNPWLDQYKAELALRTLQTHVIGNKPATLNLSTRCGCCSLKYQLY